MLNKFFTKKRHILGLEIDDWVLIILGLVVFAIIVFWTITKSSFWFDEAFGAYLIHYNFIDIARYTATDVHPPMYYWILKLWSLMFGNTELALRSMSAFFGAIAIIFGYALTNRLFNKTAARISLIFMVLSPMFIRYSQEARMYTLVAAIVLAATYVLTYAIDSQKKRPWIIYGILVGIGMWVHYFAAIVWIAHFIWRADIIRRTARKREFWGKFFSKEFRLAIYIAIGIFLPWLPFFIRQASVVQIDGFWIPPVSPGTPLNFLTNVVYYRDLGDTTGWYTFGFLAAFIFLGVLALKVYKSFNKSERRSYRLILTLAVVPALILFVASIPLRPVFIDRYLIASTLGIAMFIGVTLAYGYKFLQVKWRYIAPIFIALLMIIGIANVYSLGNYNKNSKVANQTRQIVQATVAKSEKNQPIITSTIWLFYEATFYSTDRNPVYFIAPTDYKYGSADMLKYSDYRKIKDINAFTKQNPIFWYVGWIGQSDLKAPYSNWKEIKEVTINDYVSGKPEYKAIQYRISN